MAVVLVLVPYLLKGVGGVCALVCCYCFLAHACIPCACQAVAHLQHSNVAKRLCTRAVTSSCGRVEEGDEEEEDTDGSRGGRSLGTKSSPSQSRQSSVSTRMLWKRAVKSVGTMSNVARQFRTLRDMQMPHQIPRESLKVIRVLGKGGWCLALRYNVL